MPDLGSFRFHNKHSITSYITLYNILSHQHWKPLNTSIINEMRLALCRNFDSFLLTCRNTLLFHSTQLNSYFIPLSSIHYHSTRLATSKNLFLPRVHSSSGKCSLKFIGTKVWSSIPDDIEFSTTFNFKRKLKKHLLHEKNSQLWTLETFHLSRTKYCVF